MKLIMVTPDTLEEYWIKTRSMIADACKRSFGAYEAIDVMREIAMGKMTLWVAEDEKVRGLAITEFIKYPRAKVCVVVCCTGTKLKEWLHYLSEIEAWAKSQGCNRIRPICRKGWAKLLAKMDYKPGHIELEKAL